MHDINDHCALHKHYFQIVKIDAPGDVLEFFSTWEPNGIVSLCKLCCRITTDNSTTRISDCEHSKISHSRARNPKHTTRSPGWASQSHLHLPSEMAAGTSGNGVLGGETHIALRPGPLCGWSKAHPSYMLHAQAGFASF